MPAVARVLGQPAGDQGQPQRPQNRADRGQPGHRPPARGDQGSVREQQEHAGHGGHAERPPLDQPGRLCAQRQRARTGDDRDGGVLLGEGHHGQDQPGRAEQPADRVTRVARGHHGAHRRQSHRHARVGAPEPEGPGDRRGRGHHGARATPSPASATQAAQSVRAARTAVVAATSRPGPTRDRPTRIRASNLPAAPSSRVEPFHDELLSEPMHEAEYDRAAALFEESLRIARQMEDELLPGECLWGMAAVAAAQGRPVRAACLWGAAAALRYCPGCHSWWCGTNAMLPLNVEQEGETPTPTRARATASPGAVSSLVG
jgi:hypothetical protein